jgi:hypothetical protein
VRFSDETSKRAARGRCGPARLEFLRHVELSVYIQNQAIALAVQCFPMFDAADLLLDPL